MAPVLRLEGVRKSFGGEEVLQGVSLTVLEHQATVVIGASGSGKSTLLRCVNLLETVDDGVIEQGHGHLHGTTFGRGRLERSSP